MKGFLSFLLFILLSACIGPVKELQSQNKGKSPAKSYGKKSPMQMKGVKGLKR